MIRSRGTVPGGAALWVAVVLGLLTGCGPAAAAARPPAAGLPLDKVPAAQAGAVADGTITRAEYEAGYASFGACVTDGGGRLVEQAREPSTGVITYGTAHRIGTPDRPMLDSVEGRCYHDRFAWIDFLYSTDPAVQRALASAAPVG